MTYNLAISNGDRTITGRMVLAEDGTIESIQLDQVPCSVCERLVDTDPRGDVLDSSGRCDKCRP